jgi:hypothetical protein
MHFGAGGGFEALKPFPPYEYFSSATGIAVYFNGEWAAWILPRVPTVTYNGQSYSMEHILPLDFDAQGKIYRQLTPEGVLR